MGNKNGRQPSSRALKLNKFLLWKKKTLKGYSHEIK
jgi:hypothetical protein